MSGMKSKTGILLFLLLMIIYAGTGLYLMASGVAPGVAVIAAVVVVTGVGWATLTIVHKPPGGLRSESEYGFDTTDEHNFTADYNRNARIIVYCMR